MRAGEGIGKIYFEFQRPDFQRTQCSWGEDDWPWLMLFNDIFETTGRVKAKYVDFYVRTLIHDLYFELWNLWVNIFLELLHFLDKSHPTFQGPERSENEIGSKFLKPLDNLLDLLEYRSVFAIRSSNLNNFYKLFGIQKQSFRAVRNIQSLQKLSNMFNSLRINLNIFKFNFQHLRFICTSRI